VATPVSDVPVTPDDIEAAARRLEGHVRRTPVLAMEPGAFGLDAHCVLKLELLQHAGSFKPRGAFNRVLASDVPAAGLVAASGGNHGVAVAHVARALGHRAEIFVPATSPAAKVDRIRALGADVRIGGAIYDDAQAAATARAAETGALLVHPYDHPLVVAGQGTMAREIDDQLAGFDTVLVAVGGGGLIAGACTWFGDRVRIVSVEPETIPALLEARRAGHPVEVGVSGLAADSLGAKAIGAVPFACAAPFVDDAVLVSDDAIRTAQRELWATVQLMAEPGGAAALAALLAGAYRPAAGERVVVVVCGSNVDPASVVTP
jgi:threonine dehydratase